MTFDSIRIVLVATSHPGNIGSTARAMKTMGLSRLYLVSPKSFPDRVANELAAGSDDVLENAVVTDSLAEALLGCQMVFATSARIRDIALEELMPSACAEKVSLQGEGTEIALVFGREHAGLTNDELLHCHYQVCIPSDPAYSSLNVSQAVQIMVYELRKALSEPIGVKKRREICATVEEVEGFFEQLQGVLMAIDFLKPTNPKRLLQRLRRLFHRAKLEQKEVNILRGILTQIQKALTSQSKAEELPRE